MRNSFRIWEFMETLAIFILEFNQQTKALILLYISSVLEQELNKTLEKKDIIYLLGNRYLVLQPLFLKKRNFGRM